MENKYKSRVCKEKDNQFIPHLKIYKALFFEPKYINMPYKCKMMYSTLANKLMRGVKSEGKSEYYDLEGNAFVQYTIKELAEKFNMSEATVKRYKRVLVQSGLITTSKNGQNIYINKPEVTEDSMTYGNGKLTYMHMPKFLFENDIYKNASLLAKLCYTITKDRFTYTLVSVNSKKPNSTKYIDEQGRVFCVFPNQKLSELLGVCEDRIKKAKDELMAMGLLKQKRIGINTPYRLYLYTPLRHEQMKEDEIQQEIEKDEQEAVTAKKYVLLSPERNTRELTYHKQEIKKNEGNSSKSKFRDTLLSNTSLNNTNTNIMYSMYLESKEDHTENNIENRMKDFKLRNYKFSNIFEATLKSFTYKELGTILGIMANAKNDFNVHYDTDYSLESLDFELKEMLKRIKYKMHCENKSINDLRGYLRKSTITEFKTYDISLYNSELEIDADEWERINSERLQNIEFEKKWERLNLENSSDFSLGKRIDATEAELDALGVG